MFQNIIDNAALSACDLESIFSTTTTLSEPTTFTTVETEILLNNKEKIGKPIGHVYNERPQNNYSFLKRNTIENIKMQNSETELHNHKEQQASNSSNKTALSSMRLVSILIKILYSHLLDF